MYKAVIFDMDGVIVDSISSHFKSYRRALTERGVRLTWEEFRRHLGKKGTAMLRSIRHASGVGFDVDQVYERKNVIYRSSIRSMKSFPGILILIGIFSQKFSLGLVSASSRENVDMILKRFGLKKRFRVIIASEDVQKGKPWPDMYLAAAAALRVSPRECLVFEDSEAGIRAARRAGMQCIRVNQGVLSPLSR